MASSSLYRRLSPPRVRFALCVMIAAYPLITAILILLTPITGDWPVAARTLVIVPMMVSGMVFAIIPAVHRWAGRWIAAGETRTETA